MLSDAELIGIADKCFDSRTESMNTVYVDVMCNEIESSAEILTMIVYMLTTRLNTIQTNIGSTLELYLKKLRDELKSAMVVNLSDVSIPTFSGIQDVVIVYDN